MNNDISQIRYLQQQIKQWESTQPFSPDPIDKFLGVVEEVGELAHALLKQKQGLRTAEDHDAKAKDAVGDIFIFLSAFCSVKGWDMSQIIEETVDIVLKRDWNQNTENGEIDDIKERIEINTDPENNLQDKFYRPKCTCPKEEEETVIGGVTLASGGIKCLRCGGYRWWYVR